MHNVMMFEGNNVEVFEHGEEVLFNPYHVGMCLELTDSAVRMAISSMNNKQVIKLKNSNVNNTDFRKLHNTGENFLTESGVYKLIFKSKKPNAEKFQDWVTDEVLPSIRKHGAYMTDNTIEEALKDPDFLIKLATNLKEEKAKRVQAEHQVQQLQPAYRFAKQVAKSKNTMLVREVAKLASKQGIKIGQNRLYDKLREWGLILKKGTEPDQRYVDRGYFEVAEGTKETSKGVFTHRTTMVTGKGQAYIINRLLEENA
ncbi:MAG: phage antirepressor KilAC domain-containing protein [Vallitalea sp.]|jgi:prophage antirepressor-like protein|nr:phage antirepressor KilAC domain-containing protein [Vallitalea sp.]